VLAAYNDIDAATALLDADPSLADDPEAFREAAARGHEPTRSMTRRRWCSRSRTIGVNPNLVGWLGVVKQESGSALVVAATDRTRRTADSARRPAVGHADRVGRVSRPRRDRPPAFGTRLIPPLVTRR
jgi:hypothetical protein